MLSAIVRGIAAGTENGILIIVSAIGDGVALTVRNRRARRVPKMVFGWPQAVIAPADIALAIRIGTVRIAPRLNR